MEWLLDPNIWVGLLTLIVLEIVLGIDNLIFIAILADKLPAHQRDKARLIGLSLAMFMRLALLSAISWLVTLTNPLLSLGGLTFSGRDLILLLGGLFLLFKATTELHERLEGTDHAQHGSASAPTSFAVVIAQIVVLDAVFSLDSVITAVGMVDQLPVMIAAVVISMAMMMWASRPLTRFVNGHPTVIVLCLSFLLMIGLSLTAEGLGFHIPKGYLYAAIGFSILIEFFNHVARRSAARHASRLPFRDRTAEAVLRILGAAGSEDRAESSGKPETQPADPDAFVAQERHMVSGVLALADRSIHSVMTPRTDISWIDLDAPREAVLRYLRETPHGHFPVCKGDLDNLLGVARAKDLLADLMDDRPLNALPSLRPPIVVNELAGMLEVIDILKESRGQLVMVVDEYGSVQGLLTPIDILEAIAGEFPDEDEQPAITETGPGRWRVEGAMDLLQFSLAVDAPTLYSRDTKFASIGGLVLDCFGNLPEPGDSLELDGLMFTVEEIAGRRIGVLKVERINPPMPQTS